MREGPKEPILMRGMLELALKVSEAATCPRASHGCVLTSLDLRRVLGYGYNGRASGLTNKCARPSVPGGCGCTHAECNACLKANPEPSIAFVTGHPCESCASCLINFGVEAVVYAGPAHRDIPEGLVLLDEIGIIHGTVDEVWEAMSGGEEAVDLSTPDGWMKHKKGLSRFGD